LWGPAVTGTVEEGESYEQNIRREICEELGVADIAVLPEIKELVERDTRYFLQWFVGTTDRLATEFIIEREEVAEIRWFGASELQRALLKMPHRFISAVVRKMDRHFPEIADDLRGAPMEAHGGIVDVDCSRDAKQRL